MIEILTICVTSIALIGLPVVTFAVAFSAWCDLSQYSCDRRTWLNQYRNEKAKCYQLQAVNAIGTESLTQALYCESLLITQPEVPWFAFWLSEYKDKTDA